MAESKSNEQPQKKPVRVWADGCFDVTHWGHMNALRQAKSMGDVLVVGVHSDAEIERNKGPTIMNEQERYALIRSCKWVDEVVEDAPYTASIALFDEHNIDFCVHGEDISTDANGVDVYAEAKRVGRYKTVCRTQGVSTTDIVGRMILKTKAHLQALKEDAQTDSELEDMASSPENKSPYTKLSRFYPSSQRIVQFSSGQRSPDKNDKIVYIDGAFDLFHVGHVEALRKAKEVGDYLIVGIHDDETVNLIKGANCPIMNLHERVLSVLACRHVDDVIISAPYQVTKEMIEQLNIDFLVQGSFADYKEDAPDPHQAAKNMGIFRVFESVHTDITSDRIFERIMNNLKKYENRNRKKENKEVQYLKDHPEEEEVKPAVTPSDTVAPAGE